MRIFCKNNRNWDAVQRTLDTLPGGAKVRIQNNGDPVLTDDGLVEIVGSDFVRFACERQGYADVVRVEE